MKTNKKNLSAIDKFSNNMNLLFADYYNKKLSESIKRGLELRKKRLSTSKVDM